MEPVIYPQDLSLNTTNKPSNTEIHNVEDF